MTNTFFRILWILLFACTCLSCKNKRVDLSNEFQTKSELEEFLNNCETEKDLIGAIGEPFSRNKSPNDMVKTLFFRFSTEEKNFGDADGFLVKIRGGDIDEWSYISISGEEGNYITSSLSDDDNWYVHIKGKAEKFIDHYSEENIIAVSAQFEGSSTNYFDVSSRWIIKDLLIGDLGLTSVALRSSSLIDGIIYQDAILLLNPTSGIGSRMSTVIDLNPRYSIHEDTESMRRLIAETGVDTVLQRMKGDVEPITLNEAVAIADQFVFHEDSECNRDNYEKWHQDRMLFGWDISFRHKFEGLRPQELAQYIYIDDDSIITYVNPCLLRSTGFTNEEASKIIDRINED